jgi:hypothetical protein
MLRRAARWQTGRAHHVRQMRNALVEQHSIQHNICF